MLTGVSQPNQSLWLLMYSSTISRSCLMNYAQRTLSSLVRPFKNSLLLNSGFLRSSLSLLQGTPLNSVSSEKLVLFVLSFSHVPEKKDPLITESSLMFKPLRLPDDSWTVESRPRASQFFYGVVYCWPQLSSFAKSFGSSCFCSPPMHPPIMNLIGV